ncbi:MAG: hypothetical protein FJZ63_00280 [Chlamydiae bacterium]|nr:hypothetical protein [Chlamydiota bacterium]
MKKTTQIPYYGIHAVLQIFAERKEAIQRVYLVKEKTATLRGLLKWCAQAKKPYHLVEEGDLERLTDSTHHEGVCCLAAPLQPLTTADFFEAAAKEKRVLSFYLNAVDNPHNLGAILRTLAHFGVNYLFLDHPIKLSPSCCRIAQGGAEHVKIIYTEKMEAFFTKAHKEGFTFYGTSSHKGDPLQKLAFAPKSIVVMGSESFGIAKELENKLSRFITIPGSHLVESLNVSVATALVCYDYFSKQGL